MLTPAALRLLLLLIAVTAASQFYRTSGGVIAPELMTDLRIGPEVLGLASSAFFLSLGVAQIPVGILFDRVGARRTVSGMTLIAVLGALLHAVADSGTMLVLSRALLGLGSAASFMSVVVLCSRWFPRDRLSLTLSWVFAASQIGIFLATTPMALGTAVIGWRWTFVATALATAVIAGVFFWLVRDDPPGRTPPPREPETLRQILLGIREVWRTPGLGRILAVHCFTYASMVTVLGLWAGPYLSDVHGLDAVARGNVLFAMAAAQLVGILFYGPLDRLFNTRKWIVIAGGSGTLLTLLLLALLPGLALVPAIVLMVMLCGITSYSLIVVAHGRSLFPDHLAGRGVTTVNIAQVVGSAFLPILTGFIVGAGPADALVRPESAYRLAFGAIAFFFALGLATYLTAKDVKPRQS
ncbi:MAG: MFS transporter [Alphaproteobacteria bacterium]|nr:MFS transporter [Alphaproteobacteria bacterium]